MNKFLILTSYAKFELNLLRNDEITMKLLIRHFWLSQQSGSQK